jgi:phage shock protein A
MTQQLTITTESSAALKPLLEVAIRSQIKTLELGLRRTREKIAAFETRFNMSSKEFQRRFNGRDLKETLEFVEWQGELKTLQRLEEQKHALASARVA